VRKGRCKYAEHLFISRISEKKKKGKKEKRVMRGRGGEGTGIEFSIGRKKFPKKRRKKRGEGNMTS